MCIKLEVTIPTVESFLMLFTLRQGCIIILLWTVLRSLFCLFFIIVAILEVLIQRQFSFGPILVHTIDPIVDTFALLLFFCYLAMVLVETFLLLSTFALARGLCKDTSKQFANYLVIRFVTWIAEVIFLVLLSVIHKRLIGWYLGFLFFVVLEFYGFIVVYSYYCALLEAEEASQPCKEEGEECR